MRYSRNLAVSGAMSYNPPDAVLGTSTPLWTLDSRGRRARRRDAGENGGCGRLRRGRLFDPADPDVVCGGLRSAALASAATIAAWPAYVMYAVSGMETSLYVLIIVAFVARDRPRSDALGGWRGCAGRTVPAGRCAARGARFRLDVVHRIAGRRGTLHRRRRGVERAMGVYAVRAVRFDHSSVGDCEGCRARYPGS